MDLPVIPWQLKACALAVGLAGAFAAGWEVNGWRLTSAHARDELQRVEAAAETLRQAFKERDRRADELRAANDSNLSLLQDAQHANNLLRDRVADDAVRLRVRAVCPRPAVPQASAPTGVGDGAGAELDPAARSDYHALRAAITLTERKLAGCQAELKIRTRG